MDTYEVIYMQGGEPYEKVIYVRAVGMQEAMNKARKELGNIYIKKVNKK